MLLRKGAADARLLLIVFAAREDEVVVGDGRLSRIDRVAASDLIERVNGERRSSVRGR